MSAGFDACNLNPTSLEFVGPPANSISSSDKVINAADTQSVDAEAVAKAELSTDDDQEDARRPLPANLQRVAEARKQQGLSLRTIARRTGLDVRTLRQHELPETDMKLSELRAWQLALEVPLVDLLEDDQQPLSSPVKDRATLVKIMKTVVAIKEMGGGPRLQRLADMLFDQLVELMPELREVGGWPQHGSRRPTSTSRIIEQQVNTRALRIDRTE